VFFSSFENKWVSSFLHIDICRIRALQKVWLLRFNIGSRKEHKKRVLG
jgi:hypothetical protein